jgi:hypothetical protein
MGCDYYIIKFLHIHYNDINNDSNDYLEIELDRQRCYYDEYQFDEDAEDFEEQLNAYIEYILQPKVDPIIIYFNGNFNKSSCESKYKTLIENEIAKIDKKWSDITKIIKVEKRYEN